jgi:hypothetical protein
MILLSDLPPALQQQLMAPTAPLRKYHFSEKALIVWNAIGEDRKATEQDGGRGWGRQTQLHQAGTCLRGGLKCQAIWMSAEPSTTPINDMLTNLWGVCKTDRHIA